MAHWIPQTLHLSCGVSICLTEDAVQLDDIDGGQRVSLSLKPADRAEAVQLSIAFKQAARRFEEIGKGLS